MTPELDLLRPALEMAVIVARQGESAPVRIEAPRQLRPFLRFAKLPPRALGAARAALEDDAFRARVVDRCDEEEVGAAGWLFLTRPDGWQDDLDALVAERASAVDAAAEEDARRELDRATGTIRDLQRQLDQQARDLQRLRREIDARESADQRHRDDLAEAQALTDAAIAERARAVRELKDMERRLGERTADLRRLEAAGPGSTSGPDDADGAEGDGAAPASDDRWDLVADSVADIRAGWSSVGEALDRLDALVAGRDPAESRTRRGRHRHGRHRRALRLGQGLVDGTPAAARWLLSRPGAVVLVDGYNVTMLAWPDLSVSDQRLALERATSQLQVQLGAQVVLVFDGDDEGGAAVRSAVGSPVRVRFTHRDTEADDEILEMIETVTAPVVVVVSNDRRVLDGARQRGANTIRSTEFVALMR